MKKSRLLSWMLALALMAGLLTTFASASSGSAILDEMDVNAKAAVLVDPNTNEVLYEKNASDGYKNDLLSVFAMDGLEQGVLDPEGQRKKIIIAYAINGAPLVDE